jgi:hypothetical protein
MLAAALLAALAAPQDDPEKAITELEGLVKELDDRVSAGRDQEAAETYAKLASLHAKIRKVPEIAKSDEWLKRLDAAKKRAEVLFRGALKALEEALAVADEIDLLLDPAKVRDAVGRLKGFRERAEFVSEGALLDRVDRAVRRAEARLADLERRARAANVEESGTAYLRRMYATDRCTFGDGLRAIASFAAGEPVRAKFGRLRSDLVEKEIIAPDFDVEEGAKLTKGVLAYMLVKSLGIQGGLTMRVAGVSRRYALRECIHAGLIERGSTDEFVSGRELLDIIQRAEIYRKDGSLDSIRK